MEGGVEMSCRIMSDSCGGGGSGGDDEEEEEEGGGGGSVWRNWR